MSDKLLSEAKKMDELQKCWQELENHTDGHNWYWLSYGEKCYAYACVTAFPVEENVEYPPAGGYLKPHETLDDAWVAENGTAMYVDENIAAIEQQNGGVICEFIAKAYAHAQSRYAAPSARAAQGDDLTELRDAIASSTGTAPYEEFRQTLMQENGGLRTEVAKMHQAIIDAGFQLMRTSGKWSIHDVSKYAEAERRKTVEVINENHSLEAQVKQLRTALERTVSDLKWVCSQQPSSNFESSLLLASAALKGCEHG